MHALDQGPEAGTWTYLRADASIANARRCANFDTPAGCNWLVDAREADAFCVACRLNRTIPNLDDDDNKRYWSLIEIAKRRLVAQLLSLDLPVASKDADPQRGLAFDFLRKESDKPVMTGHADGVITVNVEEADDVVREKSRNAMHEPYRTLVGHLRHEVGHYYWDRLVADSRWLAPFRELFGDERADYAAALKRNYDEGPPADWVDRHISAYAASHPWEDWAETWAHYLHMTDTLETAAACGVSIKPRRRDEPALARVPAAAGSPDAAFDRLMASWFPLTYVLNNLNRGLGVPDAYPFVLSQPAIEKLRFVHDVIAASAPARPAVTPGGSAASPDPAMRSASA